MDPITLASNAAIDLHMRTTYSNRQWQPEALFRYLVDHIAEMPALGNREGLPVLWGRKVPAHWVGQMAHLLCARAVYEALRQRGYAFPHQAEALAAQEGTLVRPADNALLLVAYGFAPSLPEMMLLVTTSGFHSMMADLAEAVDAAHAAGGVALQAHPGHREPGFTSYTPALLDQLAAQVSLNNFEMVHPSHSSAQIADEVYVSRWNWLTSIGSDSHDPRQCFPFPITPRSAVRCSHAVASS